KVMPTFERVYARAERAARRGKAAFHASVAGAEEPTVIRSFANTPREQAEVGAGVAWFGEHLSLDLTVSGVDDPADGDDVRLDGSQVAVDLGNWSVAASKMDRWWGPGWDGSLILSSNARPIPSLVIGRNRNDAFASKWLSWIGPWDLQVLFGQLESERAVPDAQFFGLRFNFRPVPSVEIGISRTAQWCGEGRPCGWDTFWDLFLGRDNLGDAGVTPENEPGNQMAGFDMRWTNRWFGAPLTLYGQMIGEDEAGGFPSRYLAQFGVEGSGITRGRTSYRWFAEVAGTSCDVVKEDLFNCGYRQGIYLSGYTYKGRIVGHGLDNDALVYSAGVVVVGEGGNAWHMIGRYGDVNRGGGIDTQHSLSPVPAELASVDLQFDFSTRVGVFEVGLGYERLEVPLTSVSEGNARGFLRWRSR
ncbi:MAG TPA: capsule assembly Wzi family protein, partial [Gammaproteobacteria bacterium]